MLRDRFGGYVEGRAIERLGSYEVRQLFLEWISRFGAPITFFLKLFRHISCVSCTIITPQNAYLWPSRERICRANYKNNWGRVEDWIGIRMSCTGSNPQRTRGNGRINRTTLVPGDPNSISPRSIVFKFEEICPLLPRSPKPFKFDHDLNIGQPVLVRILNAPKLGKLSENRGFTVGGVEGNHATY